MNDKAKALNAEIYNITYNHLFNDIKVDIKKDRFYRMVLSYRPPFRTMRNVDMEQLSNLYIGSYNV